jgi:hypothetical protein
VARLSRRTTELLVAAAAIVVLVVGGLIAFDRYKEWRAEKYVVTRTDDGRAVSRVVAAAFRGASALKVGTVSGTVQGAASDSRLFGLLNSDRVVKAPFSVDYTVDVSRLDPAAMGWDAEKRRLTVTVPEVEVGQPNVDESRMTLSTTRGVIVTRSASEALAKAVAQGTRARVSAEANRPERILQAKANARRALSRLMAAPLTAAGVTGVDVRIRFASDPVPNDQRWDESRRIPDVLRDNP